MERFTDQMAARIAYRVAAGLHANLPTAPTAPVFDAATTAALDRFRPMTTREGGR